MQAHGDIFLDRNWDTAQNHITRILTYLMEHDSKLNILFFPEGTCLIDVVRSDDYFLTLIIDNNQLRRVVCT